MHMKQAARTAHYSHTFTASFVRAAMGLFRYFPVLSMTPLKDQLVPCRCAANRHALRNRSCRRGCMISHKCPHACTCIQGCPCARSYPWSSTVHDLANLNGLLLAALDIFATNNIHLLLGNQMCDAGAAGRRAREGQQQDDLHDVCYVRNGHRVEAKARRSMCASPATEWLGISGAEWASACDQVMAAGRGIMQTA